MIAILVAAWFVCGIAGVQIDIAITKAHPEHRSYSSPVRDLDIWAAMLGLITLIFSILFAIAYATTAPSAQDKGQ